MQESISESILRSGIIVVDGIQDRNVTDIVELPVLDSLVILRKLKEGNGELRKKELIQKLEIEGIINSQLKIEAKHSRLKALLNPLSIGIDNPLVNVQYLGRQSRVTITTQGENTQRIFGD